jgi:calcineurin-like phosphoesterase family protein
MRQFVISDTHFGHKNIIKYERRPFSSVEDMDETIIQNWNEVVQEDDIVYHLGDFALTSKKATKEYFRQLNGNIRLIPGSHDSWVGRKGFLDIPNLEVMPLYVTVKVKRGAVVLCHYPMESWTASHYGTLHFHGHIHTKPFKEIPNRRNVSIELMDYKPILMNVLVDKVIDSEARHKVKEDTND